MTAIGIAAIGVGYWGPNLVRNIVEHENVDLRWICDTQLARASALAARLPQGTPTDNILDVFADEGVDAVVIATPAATHHEIARKALESGRDVLIEKPIAASVDEAEDLIALAAQHDRVLMCDHTYCYTPVVERIREVVHAGELGSLNYVDMVRVNLGLVQPDVDVVWDLAPHDLSILDSVLPDGLTPVSVSAQGSDPLGIGRSCVGFLVLRFANDMLARVHVNWMSPTKIRTVTIGGTDRTAIWDDLEPAQRLRIYDRGIDVGFGSAEERRRALMVQYRSGDMTAPALPEREALRGVVEEFVRCVTTRATPRTDGAAGLRVLDVLSAASVSAAHGGVPIEMPNRLIRRIA
jgi:predicted dehydrogenase